MMLAESIFTFFDLGICAYSWHISCWLPSGFLLFSAKKKRKKNNINEEKKVQVYLWTLQKSKSTIFSLGSKVFLWQLGERKKQQQNDVPIDGILEMFHIWKLDCKLMTQYLLNKFELDILFTNMLEVVQIVRADMLTTSYTYQLLDCKLRRMYLLI